MNGPCSSIFQWRVSNYQQIKTMVNPKQERYHNILSTPRDLLIKSYHPNLSEMNYPKYPDPSKMPILRTRTPAIQVPTPPLEGPRILRVEHFSSSLKRKVFQGCSLLKKKKNIHPRKLTKVPHPRKLTFVS